MLAHSAWSQARKIEIGDFSKKESMRYLVKKCNIKEVDAEKLYDLVGGRIVNLKAVAEDFLAGKKFEAIKQEVFGTVFDKLESARKKIMRRLELS
ncbi:P-loop containing nucleoside triphosphate hydrolase protein [Rhizophagus clarus]|uniref:P-loop containing nucleoside triphosphate hydrolase protein n=1 Tax=Rhizophagus clarus TaxID=94130 RepID=A0A8H3KU12_9GLOM|nr:P-loop containing nucleoside triphosphate hydrolase protein [Rhizophagus clarus]